MGRMTILDDPSLTVHPFIIEEAARTATFASNPVGQNFNPNLFLVFNVTVGSGLAITLSLEMYAQAIDAWIVFYTPPATITGAGSYKYLLSAPFTADASAITHGLSIVVPPLWRCRIAHGNAVSCTYSVSGYSF